MDVSGIELVLVDISGTLIVGNEPTNGAVDAFNESVARVFGLCRS
jgi:ribonucleotide monophosphatase NagD (HAD superfamily)